MDLLCKNNIDGDTTMMTTKHHDHRQGLKQKRGWLDLGSSSYLFSLSLLSK